MSENEISTQNQGSVVPAGVLQQNQYATLDSFKQEVKTSKYLPFLKLYGSNAGDVKKKKIAAGHYGLTQNQAIVDLGEKFDALLLGWRWKAVEINGDEFNTFFNPTTPNFQRVKELSSVKDSGAMYGPEFLLWLPDQKTFATYHMNSISARNEAQNLVPMIGRPVTLTWRLAESKKYQWEAPVVTACSTPFDIPSVDELKMAVDSFSNPEDSKVEQASAEATQNATSDRR